jgi:hypothetical protein
LELLLASQEPVLVPAAQELELVLVLEPVPAPREPLAPQLSCSQRLR